MKKNGGDQMDTLKILVVDDESRMRKLVKDFLTKKNFQVLEAGNGEEAMDIFYKEKDIALIKNAISLPNSSGFVEGNNNKFKLIKRILYGRSNFVDLFRKCY